MKSTKRLTEEEIRARISGRSIDIVSGSFKSIRASAQWRCLANPSHPIFDAPPRQIVHAGGGCPLCVKVSMLTEAIVRTKLDDRPLSLVNGTLRGSDKKAKWQCLGDISHGEWLATPSSVLNKKSGCPICSGKLPLTEDDIASKVKNRPLALIENSFNRDTRRALWRCLKSADHKIWDATVNTVVYQGTGCPVCAGNAPISAELITEKIAVRPIRLVEGSFKGGVLKKAQWICLADPEHPIWSATPDSVLSGSNCPACTGHEKQTPDVIRRKIKGRDLVLLSEGDTSSSGKALWGCKVSPNHKDWYATVSSVLAGAGCPSCAGNARLSEDVINERVFKRKIQIVEGTFKSSAQKATWRCLVGRNHQNWDANVGSVLSGVGCPSCATYGFDERKQAHLYLLLIGTEIDPIGIKCGITNNDPKDRLGQIKRKSKERIALISSWTHDSGSFIRKLEQSILEKFEYNDLGDLLADGGTETLFFQDLDEIIRYVKSAMSSGDIPS
jgi:hypothetical protein